MTKQQFINQWLRHFAQGLTKKQLEQYVKDQYIWHVFSYSRKESNTHRREIDFSAQRKPCRLQYASIAALRDSLFAQKLFLSIALQV